MNDRYLRVLRKQTVDRTPIWIMRQAGRYLPEYRRIRSRAGSFLNLCKTPELACEVTLQPLDRFDLDASIIFSDILTIPDAMGLGLTVNEGEGPRFSSPLRDERSIHNLPQIDVEEDLQYVMQAIQLVACELKDKIPLIGFSGSPWTLATYMVEGGGSKEFRYVKGMMHDRPELMHLLLSKITQAATDYLTAQVIAGAQSLMVFDTWGGVLSKPNYLEFCLSYMKQIVIALKRNPICQNIPVTLFTKNGGLWLQSIADSGCDAIGLDWTVSLDEVADQMHKSQVVFQGNMDPTVLYASADKVSQEATRILQQARSLKGHIFNLGHGIHPTTDPENVQVLIETVHNYPIGTDCSNFH